MSVFASSELIALCQAQVNLLVDSLGAAWCAVYLTEKWVQEVNQKLIPLVVYPSATVPQWGESPAEGEGEQVSHLLLPTRLLEGKTRPKNVEAQVERQQMIEPETRTNGFWQGKQLVLPLIYQNDVLGVLATRRDDRPWQGTELTQIDQIVHTLAIACFLDRENQSQEKRLGMQQQEIMGHQDRLDTLLHQVRSPMTALRTFSKLLLKRLDTEDRNYTVAQNIIQQSDRLQDLLKQMDHCIDELESQFSQYTPFPLLPSGTETLSLLPGAVLNIAPVDIPSLLKPLLASADAIAQEKQITFQSILPPNIPPVQADANALREVISNLIDNALKYTPSGGTVCVEAGLTQKPNYQGIAIHDTGYGIPPQDQPHIFKRHYRGVQAESDIEGTGLGLAIVNDLLMQMGGNIEMISPTSSSGKGTTFIVWVMGGDWGTGGLGDLGTGRG